MPTGVEAIAEGIDELLRLDPADLCDAELHRLVVTLHRQTHRLAAARVRLVAAWDVRHVWADDGSRSAAHRLARETSASVAGGKRELRRARSLSSMPHTARALADGALSVEHVDLLGAANSGARADVFADHEETLVEQCVALSFGDGRRMLDYWRLRADAEGCEDEAQRRVDGRTASASKTFDGCVDVRALLDPLGGAAFCDELERLAEQLRVQDLANGVMRTAGQRRADALVEMAIRSRTAADGGLRPRPLLSILVGERALADICELANGTVISPRQIVPLLSEADIERIVFDGPNRVMSVSRKRRFTGAVRRAVEVRDRHCQHPSGCDEPATRCDVDHIVPWAEGGETSEQNGRLRCWPHNRIDHLRNARPAPTDLAPGERAPPDAA